MFGASSNSTTLPLCLRTRRDLVQRTGVCGGLRLNLSSTLLLEGLENLIVGFYEGWANQRIRISRSGCTIGERHIFRRSDSECGDVSSKGAPRGLLAFEWRISIEVTITKGKAQQDDTGFVNSGFSRHMTGNIAYLSDFKEFDGGYVTFGGGTHGGRISGKGTLKTDSLDFEDVYFVNELKFNLFSVSQMCDKKNYVLFTDTECLVLSLNFKLPDESQTLLKIPRKDNMYNFDMKNIVPTKTLNCLVAKATSDESML
ncbi:hypothetical protein Tco_0696847 [Tanacetum coccineum]